MDSVTVTYCDSATDQEPLVWQLSKYNVTVPRPLHYVYTSVEITCALTALAGNFLVLLVFARCRSLRTVTNYYVISLAVADTLVATVGIPSAISTSVGLPRHFTLCLLMNSVLMLLCTGSILSLVAVTVDRFWAIVHPLTYAVDMTKRRAIIVIACCWTLASIIGLLPAAGWYRCVPPEPRCFFMEVMDFRYLAFVYFATIVCPVLFMAVVYAVIFRAVRLQVS
jgi:adenosine receptor A2a